MPYQVYRGPSAKAMAKAFRISGLDAMRIKIDMNDGRVRDALERANAAMNGHGVEGLYPNFPNFYYVNMGDTYSTTLCFTGKSFYIGTWGDWVEKHGRF